MDSQTQAMIELPPLPHPQQNAAEDNLDGVYHLVNHQFFPHNTKLTKEPTIFPLGNVTGLIPYLFFCHKQ